TPQPPGCVCHPQKAVPSYSRPNAIRMKGRPGPFHQKKLAGGTPPIMPPPGAKKLERGDELLRLFLLGRGAFLGHFLEDLARAILVADLQVGLGELELRAHRFAGPRIAAIEAQVREVEAAGGRRIARRTRGIELEVGATG